MTGVLLSMIAATCFLIAGLKHKERGEQTDANKCAFMTILSLALLVLSIVSVADE